MNSVYWYKMPMLIINKTDMGTKYPIVRYFMLQLFQQRIAIMK